MLRKWLQAVTLDANRYDRWNGSAIINQFIRVLLCLIEKQAKNKTKQNKTTHTHRICVLSTRRVKIIDHFNIGFSISQVPFLRSVHTESKGEFSVPLDINNYSPVIFFCILKQINELIIVSNIFFLLGLISHYQVNWKQFRSFFLNFFRHSKK